ncbi:hypothetical protein P691DRAFT_786694 [Macrolepiota fuliginosa MF-IS2]|uniref:Uncharacterized protein n=1 Tax=Macrolepiota fuliginosa MF-IS2 TaxID=1400762 RepID=A0A9P5X6U7_9AGAR|nr:hypothetical protein P691DRAFT_786694 [Macrolepiota fuliginosa MF-IS2]
MAETSLSEPLAWQLQILAAYTQTIMKQYIEDPVHLDGAPMVDRELYICLVYPHKNTDPDREMSAFITNKVPCLIVGSAVASIFFLRTYALWQGNRVAKSFLVLLMIGYTALIITIPAIIAREENVQLLNSHISFIPSCSLVIQSPNESKLTSWCLLGFLVLDIVLISMAILAKFKFGYRLGAGSLAKKVYTDAICYFSFNLLIAVTSVLLYYRSPGPFIELVGQFPSIATRCLSCRVILRFREYDQTEIASTTDITDIEFGANPHFRGGGRDSICGANWPVATHRASAYPYCEVNAMYVSMRAGYDARPIRKLQDSEECLNDQFENCASDDDARFDGRLQLVPWDGGS